MNIKKLYTIVITVFVVAGAMFAESFGRNKVQYARQDWLYFEVEHFTMFYQAGYEDLTRFAADILEDAYEIVSDDLGHVVVEPVPVIIYPSPGDFQETNITMSILGEGIGGFTESFKTRVVLPFNGSYEDFRHVLVHEMGHSVVFDRLFGRGPIGITSSNRIFNIPLWFAEGISEWESICWDVESDMYLRDAILNDYVVPLPYLSGFLAYKEGASVVGYIARRYGRRKVGEIIGKGQVHITADAALEAAIGKNEQQLYEDWLETKKREYFPEYAIRQRPMDIAEAITDHTEKRSYFNVMPAFSPDGQHVAFLSDRDDYIDLYVVDVIKEKFERVARGQRGGAAESFHPFRSRPGYSSDGGYLAFSRKHGGNDEIAILRTKDWKLFRTMSFQNLREISSPAFMHNDSMIVFSALSSDRSDLYMAYFDDSDPIKITDDRWDDKMPSVSPDGRYIAFSSDRPIDGGKSDSIIDGNSAQMVEDLAVEEFSYGDYNIWIYDIREKSFEPLTEDGLGNDAPSFSPNGGKIAYTSERGGVRNIWIADLDSTGERNPYTDLLSGAFTPTWDPDGSGIVFSAYFDGGFDLYYYSDFASSDSIIETPYFAGRDTMCIYEKELGGPERYPRFDGDLRSYRFESDSLDQKELPDSLAKKYTPKFSFDLVSGAVGFDTYYGFVGQTYLSFSDILGNQRITLVFDLLDDIENSTIYANYLYLSRRIDCSVMAYHYMDYFWDNNDRIFSDRIIGFGGDIRYPFSQFDRIEAAAEAMHIKREFVGIPSGTEWPDDETPFNMRLSCGAVHDNTLWGNTGPLEGSRLKVAAEYVPKVSEGSMDFYAGQFDLRKYVHFGDGYSFAMRLAGGAARGKSTPIYWLGGSSSWLNWRIADDDIYSIADVYYSRMILPMRGHDYFEYSGQTYAIANLELRYPFVQYLKLGMPPVTLGGINGALFMDIGAVTGTDLNEFRGWKGSGFEDIKMGVGVGMRAWFWWFLFSYDLAWKTDIDGIAPKPYHHLSLGAEF